MNNSSLNNRIIVIVLALLCFVVLGFVSYKALSNMKDDNGKESDINNTNNDDEVDKEVLDNEMKNEYKSLAVAIINGVRQKLIIENKLSDGDYYFSNSLLNIDGSSIQAPLNREIKNGFNGSCMDDDKVGENVCIKSTSINDICTDEYTSYVRIHKENGINKYSICLTTGVGSYYISLGSEEDLLNVNNNDMIVIPQEK